MQSFTDVPVKCCDCQKTFLSASSLLCHFAHHAKIITAKSNYEKFKSLCRKTKSVRDKNHLTIKLNNSVEKVSVKNNLTQYYNLSSSSPITSNESSLQSVISDKSELNSCIDLSDMKNSCERMDSVENDLSDDNAQPCPSKSLAIDEKADSLKTLTKEGVSERFCVEFNSDKLLINIKKISKNDVVNTDKSSNLEFLNFNNNNNNEIFDKNQIFIGNEYDDKIECNNNKRKLSNRKQLMPKKIERTLDGLIKIAPRPDDVPVSYGREVQNKKSSNRKKYNCHLCTKVFGWSTDLKRHILVHTGERPYKCAKCSACFTRNFLLQKHKSKIHPCNKEFIEKNKLLEEKVNENLIQLRNKMMLFDNDNKISIVKAEHSVVNEDYNGDCNNDFEEEMTIEESKLDIKEELQDPLADTSSSLVRQDNFVNGNWILTKNNDEKFVNSSRNEVLTVGPIKIVS